MRVYSPEECKEYISNIDISGDVFEYAGKKDYGVYGYYPIPVELINEVIKDINYPMDKVNVPIFSLPFRLMVYDKDGYGWTGRTYNGRAYPTHVLLGAMNNKPTKEDVGALVIHELGHIICYKYVDPEYDYKFTDKFKEYLKIRGAEHWSDKSMLWKKRPSELFAEDFRYLFGTQYMRDGDKFLQYQYIDPPKEEVKEWFLSLIGEQIDKKPETPEENKPIEDNKGGNKEMKFKDTKGHWAEHAIDIISDMGLMRGYADKTFKPDKPITRAEMSVVILRILNELKG